MPLLWTSDQSSELRYQRIRIVFFLSLFVQCLSVCFHCWFLMCGIIHFWIEGFSLWWFSVFRLHIGNSGSTQFNPFSEFKWYILYIKYSSCNWNIHGKDIKNLHWSLSTVPPSSLASLTLLAISKVEIRKSKFINTWSKKIVVYS